MLIDCMHAAMGHARYEILDDDEGFYGEMPPCSGVFANADTLEACRDQLAEVLEDWILFRVSQGLELPLIDGKCIRIERVA
ncbi:MAG: type II toxin-antitoxin system HicB family antitoxin [Thiohalocapsa sp.]|jgi:predicted RNase H-like HicB family nuclease|uniref:type II toxin-antitoxin system HicB family antitoxin n=1 Tax=Thiohalocapsa sp. TaxID=2497641 RepID=UPI0025F6AEF6|nr:type II toxin-antitoxin system HicB family antitoxin [Thiohalocapsa sp.]MCG6939917.1 type II toxin-antitoxin system HicB family antitoxin [Thiohalocapsa sp.]